MLMLRPSAIIASIAGTPSGVAGIFTNRFGSSIRSWRPPGGGERGVDLPGQLGSDLDRDEAVGPGGRVVDRAEDGEGGGDVGDDQFPVGVLDRNADGGQGGELFVVVGRNLDSTGENRRGGGDD